MQPFQNSALTPRERAIDLLARLSLREKVGQVNQGLYGFSCYTRTGDTFTLTEECLAEIEHWGGLGVLYGLYRADPWSNRNASTGIPPHLAAKAYNLVQQTVINNSRFGIPVLMTAEASHGMTSVGGYLLPANLAMAATFNPTLCRDAFGVYGKQAAAQGIDYALVSVLDVLRDPRWGRSEECFGEDPFLAAEMAQAAVSGCAVAGVDVVAKHLCAQGETTGGINSSAARIGPRELKEIHLPPLFAALRGGAKGIMAAYNEIDGIPCHANPALLKDFLRDECQFDGIVMADGTAIDRLDEITGSNMRSGALALESGVDISLWDTAFSHLEEAVTTGAVSEDRLNEAVLRVLETKFRRGLFEHPYLDETSPMPNFSDTDYPQSGEASLQSIVLLENRNVLPLNTGNVAVIGPNADDFYNQLGDYSPPFGEGEGVTPLAGIRSIAGAQVRYAKGCDVLHGDETQLQQAVAAASQSDVVVLCLGGSSNRFGDVHFDETGAAIPGSEIQMDCGEGVDKADLNLPACQLALFEALVQTGKPIITVIISGRPLVLTPLKDKSAALLYSFYPGPCGGEALAKILFGKTSPSGRLPASLPRDVGTLPCFYNGKYAAKNRVYCDMDSAALYPFGSGCSYASFQLQNPVIEQKDGVQITFMLSNTSNIDSYAVPLLFIRWETGMVVARKKELKAFGKYFLPGNCERTVTLSIPAAHLNRLNANMKEQPGTGLLHLMLEEGGQCHWQGQILLGECNDEAF